MWFALIFSVVLALILARYGATILATISWIFVILSAVLVIGVVAATWQQVDFESVLNRSSGSWMLVLTGAAVVFSVFGVAWASAGGNQVRDPRARIPRPASTAGTMIGAAVPAIVLAMYGWVISTSDPRLGERFSVQPFETLMHLSLPSWYLVALLAAIGGSLISALTLIVSSGAEALRVLHGRIPHSLGVLITGLAVLVLAALYVQYISDLNTLIVAGALTLAVPLAAWLGVLCTETMLRRKEFDSNSLRSRGGVYPDWRWFNLGGVVVSSTIGFGFMPALVASTQWRGFLFQVIGVDASSPFAASCIGVFISLMLGLATPLLTGIREIHRQESLHQ